MPVSPMPKITLSMIVKDEGERIERCLKSIAGYIDAYCIVDTGSTDNTKALIRETLKHIPGEILDRPFDNFSSSRNWALRKARSMRQGLMCDFVLLVDADMELVVESSSWKHDLRPHFHYAIEQRAGISYWNTRIVPRMADAKYIGATHEYLRTELPAVMLNGVHFVDHADGANRAGKFKRDVALLTAELNEGGSRALFYLAQSYRDLGMHRMAAQLYRTRSMLGGYDEEAWHAKLSEARCLRALGDVDGFVAAATAAYALRPLRMEPLSDLMAHWLATGAHELVMRHHLAIGARVPPMDALFVETDCYGLHGSIAEHVSVAAFYVDGQRERGHEIVEDQALSPECPAGRRDLARANLRFYAKPIEQLLRERGAVATITRLMPPLDEGWVPCNPSVLDYEGFLVANVRAVNYLIREDGSYAMAPDGVIRTRNYYAQLDPAEDGGFTARVWHEIDEGNFLASLGQEGDYGGVKGLEDMRLFPDGDEIGFVACVRELNHLGMCEQFIGRIGGVDRPKLTELRRLSNSAHLRHEKNWTPVIESSVTDCFIYDFGASAPRTSLGSPIGGRQPGGLFALDHLRGGTQAIPFQGRLLTVTHEVVATEGQRTYLHRFVLLDAASLARVDVSQAFVLGNARISFAAGLAYHPLDATRLVLSYGVMDREAYVMELPISFVEAMWL